MHRRNRTLLVLLCLSLTAAATAQSHDRAHPTPLAPGVNKGNVDNTGGPVYFYFNATPGRVDFNMAFHEMGVFGNPLRQTVTFSLTNDKGKVFFTQPLISQGNLAKIQNHGTFDTPQRVLLTVTAQNATIRMGGYFEFEMTGAVAFDGKRGSSANIGPEDTSLTTTKKNGPVALTSGTTSLTSGAPVALTSGTPVQLTYPGKALTVQETSHEVRILLAADVLFDFNQAQIRSDAVPTLKQAAARMRSARPHSPILVEGYTDAKGSNALNLKLSQQRAEAVETWFIQNAGFSVSAFTPKGFGAARPVAPNTKTDGQDNPAGRQLNRRVEIVVAR